MNSNTRTKLERNLQYHQNMADYYAEEAKKSAPKADAKPADKRPVASAASPPVDQNKILHDIHADVVKQLKHVLSTPAVPRILVASAAMPVVRNTSPELKPNAGRFH